MAQELGRRVWVQDGTHNWLREMSEWRRVGSDGFPPEAGPAMLIGGIAAKCSYLSTSNKHNDLLLVDHNRYSSTFMSAARRSIGRTMPELINSVRGPRRRVMEWHLVFVAKNYILFAKGIKR